MKLLNNEGEFKIVHNGIDYNIPNGEFEVTNDMLGYFIQRKAIDWGKKVEILEETTEVLKPRIKKVKSKQEVLEKEEKELKKAKNEKKSK